jgi:hypothetical protein
MNWITMGSFFLCIILSSLPFIFLWKAYNPYNSIKQLMSYSPVLKFILFPALCAPFVLSVVTTDFGRHVSVGFLTYLFFIYAVCAAAPATEAAWVSKFKANLAVFPRLRYALLIFAVTYALSWRMVHYQDIGQSYLKSGPLLSLWQVIGWF